MYVLKLYPRTPALEETVWRKRHCVVAAHWLVSVKEKAGWVVGLTKVF